MLDYCSRAVFVKLKCAPRVLKTSKKLLEVWITKWHDSLKILFNCWEIKKCKTGRVLRVYIG